MQWGATECGLAGSWRNLIGVLSAGLARALLMVAMLGEIGRAHV